MKKLTLSLILVLIALGSVTGGALAAASVGSSDSGNFTGSFYGYILGDRDSQAKIELNLTQVDDDINGELVLSEGLYIDAGRCWNGYLPEGSFTASGSPTTEDAHRVEASYTYEVSGMSITGYLDGVLSPDGEELTAEVEIDIPWFCGPDPVLQVSAQRQH